MGKKIITIRKYDIIYIKDTDEVKHGSVQQNDRPAIVLQNDKGNIYSPTTIVAFLTSQIKRLDLPTHVIIDQHELKDRSMAMLEQITTVDKRDITRWIGTLNTDNRQKVDNAMLISLGAA